MVGTNRTAAVDRFISPIFSVANPNLKSVCKTFFERPLSDVINNYKLNVITDCMIASYSEAGLPVNPYFFIQVGSPMRFKQAQRFGKTDGSGRPSTRSNACSCVTRPQRRTVKKSMMLKNHYMAAM